MHISDKLDGQEILDMLAQDISDSIDNEILYMGMGWNIIEIPGKHSFNYNSKKNIEKWLDDNVNEHFMWDGKIAFKDQKDATMFLLRWS